MWAYLKSLAFRQASAGIASLLLTAVLKRLWYEVFAKLHFFSGLFALVVLWRHLQVKKASSKLYLLIGSVLLFCSKVTQWFLFAVRNVSMSGIGCKSRILRSIDGSAAQLLYHFFASSKYEQAWPSIYGSLDWVSVPWFRAARSPSHGGKMMSEEWQRLLFYWWRQGQTANYWVTILVSLHSWRDPTVWLSTLRAMIELLWSRREWELLLNYHTSKNWLRWTIKKGPHGTCTSSGNWNKSVR